MPTKTTTATGGKSAAPKAPRKPRATTKKKEVEEVVIPAVVETEEVISEAPALKPTLAKGKYIFATGRRKTSIANVRLFGGTGDSEVNKKPFTTYFDYSYFQDEVVKPLHLTGLGKDYYFYANIRGGGKHSQAQALRHGIATALGQLSEEVRKVLKKNGMLTRDDRKKERKKPGLKRARRSPQWAKR